MKIEKKQYINATFSNNFEKVNSEFLKCTVSLVTHEQIANGTRFMENAIEEARYSLNYLPVIGWFKKNSNGEDDFSDHGIEYIINNDGIQEVCHTIPFGVIIPNSSRYEMITADNGEKQKYLVADCYMWKRYDKAIDVLKENTCNQSVEIELQDYEYRNECVEINKFNFTGVCVLSSDCQPAFNLAKIRTSDKFCKDEFKACYSEMTSALDKFLNFEEGGNEVEDFKKKRKCGKCETEYEIPDDFSDDEEFICDSCKEENTFSKKTTTFELSFDDIREKLYQLIKKEDCYCWIVETFTDKFIYVNETWEDDKYECRYYEQGYEMDNEDIKLVGDSIEVFAEFLTQEEIDKLNEEKQSYTNNIETLKAENYDLQTKFGELDTEVKSLREYKAEIEQAKFEAEETNRKKSIDSELEEFSELSSCDGYKEIMDKKYEVEVEKSKILLKALAYDNGIILGKKKNFSKKDKTVVTIPIENIHVDIEKDPYDGILDKYINKK